MHIFKWSLIILAVVVAVNVYALGVHLLIEARDKSYPVECETYGGLQEVQAGLLERGFDHSAYLGLADSSVGERVDGSEHAYFRIDSSYSSDYMVCYYDWPSPDTDKEKTRSISAVIHEPETADRRIKYDELETADRRVIYDTSIDLLPPRQDWNDRCAILVLRESYGSNAEEEAMCGRRTYR